MRFSGSMTALITPFKDGRIDAEALERIVDLQIQGGTSALVPCGSTGESATLTHQEHVDIVGMVVKFARRRVPVIAGTGSNSTTEAISLTKAAKEIGADAALLISPYYNRPTQDGIFQHYTTIAEQTRFPLIVYNIPGRTGSKIEAATIARLAENEHIIGLKEATGSLDEVQEVIRLCGDSLEIYCGDDALTLPIMAVGGTGVISVGANLVPSQSSAMANAALAGNWAEARQLHFELLPLYRVLFLETNPIPIKAAMSMAGHCRDELRLPLLPLSSGPRGKLKSVMEKYGLLRS